MRSSKLDLLSPQLMNLPALPSQDAEHLKLLAIFHYVMAGFSILGLAFLALHYWFMQSMFASSHTLESAHNAPPPWALNFFTVFYLVGGLALVAAGVMNFLSAVYMGARRHRVFSLIVAGLNCLSFPLGTALGVFTIVVLCRDSVRVAYLPHGIRDRHSAGYPASR